MFIGLPITDMFNSILALMLAMARIFLCLRLIPIFSFTVFKGATRTAIVVSLALFMVPVIKPQLDLLEPSMLYLAGLVFKELVIGMLMGLLIAMPFWMYESIGGLFDNQRGALMGGQINPQLGPDETPIGTLMQQSIILLLFIGLGVSVITQIFWDSYLLWPATEWIPSPTEAGFKIYLKLLSTTFSDMVLYAGPLVVIMLFMDFAIGIMSIYSPQLQATVLTVPIKCLFGMLFFVLYLPLLDYLANQRLYELRELIHLLPSLVDPKGSAT